MEWLSFLLDLVLHLDKHLLLLTQDYGAWVYLILFLIIFSETGLVVAPFLPGDSLLFVAGALTASAALDTQTLIGLLVLASFMGDNTNYWVGRYLGPKVFRREDSRFLKREYLERTHRFYEKHGGKAIILARFFPIIRTFAPFVAGVGRMDYRRFLPFSLAGSTAWVGSLVLAGHFFGDIPFIKHNLTLVIFAIVILSLLPGALGYLRHRTR